MTSSNIHNINKNKVMQDPDVILTIWKNKFGSVNPEDPPTQRELDLCAEIAGLVKQYMSTIKDQEDSIRGIIRWVEQFMKEAAGRGVVSVPSAKKLRKVIRVTKKAFRS